MNWDNEAQELNNIQVISNKENEPVIIKGSSERMQCIGVGTDAAVFRWVDSTKYAFKVYSEEKIDKMENEVQVYLKLGDSQYYPTYYGSYSNFLVISYEEGVTLYDCLLKGIHIPEQAIQDVDAARRYAKNRGLNPRDIHLKNILLHEGRAKLIDVSEYTKPGNDHRWEYLKKGYNDYYHLIDGKPIPFWIIDTVRKWYNQTKPSNFNFQDFVHTLLKLFRIGHK